MTKRLPLTEAALRLGLDYQQCRRLVLSGRLAGGRDEYGHLYAEERAVLRALKQSGKRPTDVSQPGEV